MKILLTIALITSSLLIAPVSAKKKDKSKKHEAKASSSGFKEDHPVFGSGKLHPVHDDKVIGKFKNADKIKEKVAEIDEMDEASLGKELEDINQEIDQKKEEISKLRKERLEKILQKKDELLKNKTELEKATDNPLTGMMNQVGLFMNDMQLSQVKNNETKVLDELKEDSAELEEKMLIKSYVESK